MEKQSPSSLEIGRSGALILSLLGTAGLGLFFCSLAPLRADDSAALFHFSGPGKVSPQIVSIVEGIGGRVDWGPNNLIAYDKRDSADRLQIWLMGPDGSSPHWLKYQNDTLITSNVGAPAWHPSANYLVAEATDIPSPAWADSHQSLYKQLTNPGFGFNNNLWLISADGSHLAPLTHIDPGHGVLHPRFSHHGDLLAWSEMVSLKPQKWVIHVGKFEVGDNGPQLTAIQTLDPLNNAFYEVDDFSSDDKSLLISTTKNENDYWHLNIVRLDLATGQTKPITDPSLGEWNQYAHESPDGSKIAWMTSAGISQDHSHMAKTDYWTMNADGSNKHRLSFFNEPGAQEFRSTDNIASDFSWSPDGQYLMTYLQMRTPSTPPESFPGSIIRIAIP